MLSLLVGSVACSLCSLPLRHTGARGTQGKVEEQTDKWKEEYDHRRVVGTVPTTFLTVAFAFLLWR